MNVGTVHLTVSDLDRSRAFYEQLLGLRGTEAEDGTLSMGAAASGPPLLTLTANGGSPRLDRSRTGLYHFAVLVPTRRDLAVALARLASARWPLSGASDHLASEALYLDDPDGNGIEIYADRPRSEWRYDETGAIEMTTLPMDIEGVLGELAGAPPDPEADRWLPEGTRMGHVHLQVSELDEIERFYTGVLGFDVMLRGFPGALFVSSGGYHHHVGLNTWHSRAGARPEPGAIGLRSYELRLDSADEVGTILGRADDAGVAIDEDSSSGAPLIRDPSGNAILLTC